jgi:hypothetical protein
MKNKIFISSPADRNNVVVALTNNGYTVRIGAERVGKRSEKYIEYEREEEEHA